jgi:hypothetical protein
MKILFLAASFFVLSSFGQPTPPSALAPILTAYYQVKDALVAGNAAAVATAAGEMLKQINGVDRKVLSSKDQQVFAALQDKLAFDARHMSESKDISHQREHFTSLSTNLFTLARKTRLSGQPVYEAYCPMKKAYWLSADSAIRNPYFGSSMIDCGKVTATINP